MKKPLANISKRRCTRGRTLLGPGVFPRGVSVNTTLARLGNSEEGETLSLKNRHSSWISLREDLRKGKTLLYEVPRGGRWLSEVQLIHRRFQCGLDRRYLGVEDEKVEARVSAGRCSNTSTVRIRPSGTTDVHRYTGPGPGPLNKSAQ